MRKEQYGPLTTSNGSETLRGSHYSSHGAEQINEGINVHLRHTHYFLDVK